MKQIAYLFSFALLACLVAAQAFAAGSSLACSAKRSGQVYEVYCLATSDDSTGAVSGSTSLADGVVVDRVVFVPNLAGTQPTNLFDVTMVDVSGADLLGTAGGNLVNTGPTSTALKLGATPAATASLGIRGALTFAFTNMGNSKTCGVYITGRK